MSDLPLSLTCVSTANCDEKHVQASDTPTMPSLPPHVEGNTQLASSSSQDDFRACTPTTDASFRLSKPDLVETTSAQNASPTLSTARLFLAHFGAALTLFLATTDATLVSTSLPTIASELSATQAQYTWVGVSYMLTQTALQPLYGRTSDLVGRKTLMYASILIFSVGSVLCGASRDIKMLICSRALAGIGGGGIVSSVWVITSEIVEVRNRPKWSMALSITWSCSAIAGPLLGGLFSGSGGAALSWRWCFYLNLPVSAVAALVLAYSLRNVQLRRASMNPWTDLRQRFDFGGLFLFMTGTGCLVVGFSFASDSGWTSPRTLLLIVIGFLVLICGGVYERHTKRDPLFPATVFSDPTGIIVLVITFLHNFAFNAGTFYLALFYQAAHGYSPLDAGIRMLPYSLGSSLASMPASWFITYWQKRTHSTRGQNWVISAGLLISTIGFGLMTLLNEDATVGLEILIPLIAGIGIGMLFHAPYEVFLHALKPSELATGTSAFFLVRFTGATIGLAVAGAVFYARAATRIPTNLPFELTGSSIDITQLEAIEPAALRQDVLRIISTSIQTVWTLMSPCLGISCLLSLLLRSMPVKEKGAQPQEKEERSSSSMTDSSTLA